MKFIDWYNFNFVEHKVMNLSSIYMEVMRKKVFRKYRRNVWKFNEYE